jgi:endonuclease-3
MPFMPWRPANVVTRIGSRRPGTRVLKAVEELERLYGVPRKRGTGAPPLETLIGTLLSQNTNDQNSYRAWVNLRRKYPAWEDVASAPLKSVAAAIKVGGLKNQKAKRIKEILHHVKREWGAYSLNALRRKTDDEVMDYLLAMKGIGEKTAACVLVISLNRDVFPVDTHIHRICNRLGLVATKSADETFRAMKELVPERKAYSFHVNLIQFGREVCKSARPQCMQCPLFDECIFDRRHAFADVSANSSRKRRTGQDFMVIEHLMNYNR